MCEPNTDREDHHNEAVLNKAKKMTTLSFVHTTANPRPAYLKWCLEKLFGCKLICIEREIER
jgi:hypothetical protein